MSRREEQSLLPGQRTNGATIVPNGSEVEKTPFLSNEPVRLTPAWEENNLPNDELNFKGMTMERARMEINPPKDAWNLVFITLIIHGIGTLMPWNMFITAKAYFVDYKMDKSYTGFNSEYAGNFLAYVGFAAQIPNLLFNWLNVFVNVKGSLTTRIVLSLLVEVLVFIVTIILAMMNSSEWPGAFFWITMVTIVILNMASGIYQNTIYGIAAKLPIKYTGAVVLGSNICGTFTAIVMILSSEFSSSLRTAAIYYFITAMFVILFCFDTYFALPLNKFYRYHEILQEKEEERNKLAGRDVNERPPYWKIFKQCFPQLFNVFFIFFVTLSIFPSVHSDIHRSDNEFFISKELYTSITCFLTFNFFAMIGSSLTSFFKWPSPKYLVWAVVARVLFIPIFVFCNYHPTGYSRALPVYIDNDWIYWAMAVLMALSSGYLSSLGMMYTPQSVEPKYALTAGMFAAAMLITGIFTGILFSMVFPTLVANVTW